MPITSDNNSLKFQMPCAERLPCGRCKLTMGMCPDNYPYTVTWTTADTSTTTQTPKKVDTTDPLWDATFTADPNNDAFKELMC